MTASRPDESWRPPSPPANGLGYRRRAAMRLRHSLRLAGHVAAYAVEARMWWLLPFVAVLLAIALVVTAAHAAVPVAVYTLF